MGTLSIELDDEMIDRIRRERASSLSVRSLDILLHKVTVAARSAPRPVTKDDPPPWGHGILNQAGDLIGYFIGRDPTTSTKFVAVADGEWPAVYDYTGGYTWRPVS